MYTKLTLNLEKEVIREAKHYAQKNRLSLSKIVGKYLASLTRTGAPKYVHFSPLTEELSGILRRHKNVDAKKIRYERLKEKYL